MVLKSPQLRAYGGTVRKVKSLRDLGKCEGRDFRDVRKHDCDGGSVLARSCINVCLRDRVECRGTELTGKTGLHDVLLFRHIEILPARIAGVV